MGQTDNTELIEAIKKAMEGEKFAAGFYKSAADKTPDPRGKDMLLQLSAFEQSHYDSLAHALDNIESGGAFTDYGEQELNPGQIPEEPLHPVPPDAIRSDIDALTVAIEAEIKARDHYRQMSENAQDPALAEMLRKMAAEEEMHRRILEDQFTALSNKGHWTWGE